MGVRYDRITFTLVRCGTVTKQTGPRDLIRRTPTLRSGESWCTTETFVSGSKKLFHRRGGVLPPCLGFGSFVRYRGGEISTQYHNSTSCLSLSLSHPCSWPPSDRSLDQRWFGRNPLSLQFVLFSIVTGPEVVPTYNRSLRIYLSLPSVSCRWVWKLPFVVYSILPGVVSTHLRCFRRVSYPS